MECHQDYQDEALFNILSSGGQILQFFESIFGFLYRRTDFYKIQKDPGDEFGFPPGVAENIVMRIYKQWEDLARKEESMERIKRLSSDGVAPAACEELEISDLTLNEPGQSEQPHDTGQSMAQRSGSSKLLDSEDSCSESYNGAVREGYSWSQTISDVDVTVLVPLSVARASNVTVEVTAHGLSVRLAGSTEPLVRGDFPWRTKKEEAVWSLVPGKFVQVHLEKCEERWWDSLLTSEPKIDLRHIDPTRPLDEMSQCDQMKVQELVWNEELRAKGQPPPLPENLGNEEMLRLAWHQEGSPFKDLPFDPSLVTFGNSNPLSQPHNT